MPWRGALDQLAQRVDGLARGLPRPEMLLGLAAQRLDDLGERLRLRSPSELVRRSRSDWRRGTRGWPSWWRDRLRRVRRPTSPARPRGWCPS